MAKWTFAVTRTNASGDSIRELTAADGRSLKVSLEQPHEAAFTISARDDEAKAIGPGLTRDLVVYRDTDKLFRGRITPPRHTINADTHAMQVQALSYKAALQRRGVWTDTLSFGSQDQEAIFWGLIDHTQNRTGGDLGITRGTGQTTGVNRARDYEGGQNIAGEIDLLSQADDGFEWDIDPDLIARLYYPQRGAAQVFKAHYGGTVTEINDYQGDVSRFANAHRITTPGALTAATHEAPDLATREEGRWEHHIGIPGIADQNALDETALGIHNDEKDLRSAIKLTLKRGVYPGPQNLWVGDTIGVNIASGTLNVDTTLRIHEIVFSDLDNADGETVTLTLDRITLDLEQRLRRSDGRIDNLER